MSLPSISDLNASSFETFCEIVSLLFEPAPPLAKALYALKPFESYDHLLLLTSQVLKRLSPQDRLEVINAHPRIGAPKTQLSSLSAAEQGYSKVSVAPSATTETRVLEELAALNKEYEKVHGFKVCHC
jgi:2-oxo-4-hydroxy-4-carboxy--5-ureidoimidazoline (OHCU) decarboxylase